MVTSTPAHDAVQEPVVDEKPEAARPPHKNVLEIMGQHGDTKVLWDPENPDEVAAARTQFDDLVKRKRFLAYAVKKKGGQGARITEFDPQAGATILVPPMAGGTGG
jgi:hypothetical protein